MVQLVTKVLKVTSVLKVQMVSKEELVLQEGLVDPEKREKWGQQVSQVQLEVMDYPAGQACQVHLAQWVNLVKMETKVNLVDLVKKVSKVEKGQWVHPDLLAQEDRLAAKVHWDRQGKKVHQV